MTECYEVYLYFKFLVISCKMLFRIYLAMVLLFVLGYHMGLWICSWLYLGHVTSGMRFKMHNDGQTP